MAVDSTELSKADKQNLAAIAEKSGDEALLKAVHAYIEHPTHPQQDKRNGAELLGFEEDTECFAYCMEELGEIETRFGPNALTDEEAQRILSKVQGSVLDALNADRGER